ncbi:MAG: reverse transcriptase domain-containing protein, partial [Propionibacteriaceae bacterium]
MFQLLLEEAATSPPPSPPFPEEVLERSRNEEGNARDGVPPHLLPEVGGCLASHWATWQRYGAENWIVDVLREGYLLPFESRPPLISKPVHLQTYVRGSAKDNALRQEIKTMLAKRAVEIVEDQSPGFYSRLFLVEKASGGWRPVIDLSPLNRFVRTTRFTMESARSVLDSIRGNDFMLSVDLKDAYFQIPIHQSSRKYLRFIFDGTVYQFRALCFGLSTAPQVFTRVFTLVSAWAHSNGIRLLRYLDDWLVLASSRSQLLQDRDRLLKFCRDLGIVINYEKSDLEPKQKMKYLGMLIDTVAGQVFPADLRISKFREEAGRFLSRQEQAAQQWQVVIGHLSSLEKLVPHGRLHLRSLQWRLRESWSQAKDPPYFPVALTDKVRQDLAWWLDDKNLLRGVPIRTPPPEMLLFSDASTEGWG